MSPLGTAAALGVALILLGFARLFWRAAEASCICPREALAPARYCPEHGDG